MFGGEMRGYLFINGEYVTDRAGDVPVSSNTVRGRAATLGQEVTFTCVPPGSGVRIGIDRDGDSYGDGDEVDGGSDPADAGSVPTGVAPVCATITPTTFKSAIITDKSGRLSLRAEVLLGGYGQEAVSATATDSDGPIFAVGVAGNQVVLKGSTFKYKAPSGSTGLTYVTLKEKKNSGGVFKVTARTKGAWTAGAADEDEVTTVLTLNIGGACFRGNAKHVR
jgi:hypothetical protein